MSRLPPPLPLDQPRLTSLADIDAFIASAPPWQLAQRLRHDQALARAGKMPTLLAQRLPNRGKLADAIAMRLMEIDAENFEVLEDAERLPAVVTRNVYRGVVDGIREYLASPEEYNNTQQYEQEPEDGEPPPPAPPPESSPFYLIPKASDYATALKVLQYLTHSPSLPPSQRLDPSTPLSTITTLLTSNLSLPTPVLAALAPKPRQKRCYICRYEILSAHPLYPALCVPCGEFNTFSASLCAPTNLASLAGKTALVTGARVNLGFHTAVQLLRCGARVIATSRYPFDAEKRFRGLPDAETWRQRLRVVGADFRRAKDVFRLVETVKRVCCRREWAHDDDDDEGENERERGGLGKLDILINNAAQTLTDRIDDESRAVRREQRLSGLEGAGKLVLEHATDAASGSGYRPAIRGGGDPGQQQQLLGSPLPTPLSSSSSSSPETPQTKDIIPQPIKSSWTQHLTEIPYEDLLSAHSVNAFVPFILLRELLPNLALPHSFSSISAGTRKAANGYIINVSSRESIPERRPSHGQKAGRHVHTNMSKAALNMLTETQAEECWRLHHVAVNSVDPGYMSADPEWMQNVFGGGGVGGDDAVGAEMHGNTGKENGQEEDKEMEMEGSEEEDAPKYVYKGEKPFADPPHSSHPPPSQAAAQERTYECPLSWHDGVARVLFPIALAEGACVPSSSYSSFNSTSTATGNGNGTTSGNGRRGKQKSQQGEGGGGKRRVLWGRFLRHFRDVDVARVR